MERPQSESSNLSLLVFLFSSVFVILAATKPCRINLPKTSLGFTFHFGYPPVIGVLVLLASKTISWEDVGHSVAGEGVSPLTVVMLFMSFAFICASLDMTGLFAWMGLRITEVTSGSCVKVYLAYFVLSSVMTVFTSNDIVIMTLTPIVFYFTSHTGTEPLPFLLMSFFAANIMSAAVLIGNPTNIIVAEAFDITFVTYLQWMLAPSLAGSICSGALGLWYFKPSICRTVQLPPIHSSEMMKDLPGAIFGSVNLCAYLVGLALAPSLGITLWQVSFIFAGVQLLYNSFHYAGVFAKIRLLSTRTSLREPEKLSKPHRTVGQASVVLSSGSGIETKPRLSPRRLGSPRRAAAGPSSSNPDVNAREPVASDIDVVDGEAQLSNGKVAVPEEAPPAPARELSFLKPISALPWAVVPFIFGMFALVESLKVTGWIEYFAELLTAGSGSTVSTVFLTTFLSILLANTLTTQPMTILMTRVLMSQSYTAEAVHRMAAAWSVVFASNVGTNFTLIGCLAGVMWTKILAKKGLEISFLQFARYGLLLNIPVVLVAMGVLLLELHTMEVPSSLLRPAVVSFQHQPSPAS